MQPESPVSEKVKFETTGRQMNAHQEVYLNVFSKDDTGELKSFQIKYPMKDTYWDNDTYEYLMCSRAYSLKDLLCYRKDVFSRIFYMYLWDVEGRKVDYNGISPMSVLKDGERIFPLVLEKID